MLFAQVGILSITLKLATQKDAHKWNEIVERDPQGNFFDRFEWCQALGLVSKNIIPLPLIIEENEEASGVFPLCLVRQRLFADLESLPFSDYGGGPFFRREDILKQTDFSVRFYNSLIEFGLTNKCIKISIRRAYFPDLINKATIEKPVIIDTNTCTFLFSLQEGIDQLYQKVKNSRRRSIRQGEKRGTIVYEAKDLGGLQNFYEIYVHSMTRLGTIPLPFSLLDHIWNVFIPKDEAKIFIAEYNNKPMGAILLFIYKGVCHAWTGGSLDMYQDKRPMDVLLWHSIKWATTSGLELFDLGSTPNNPSSGHYFFKESWGGKKVTLYNYHILLQPMKLKFARFGKKILSNIEKSRMSKKGHADYG